MPTSPLGVETRSHYAARLYRWLGIRVSGDIGHYSMYTDRQRRTVVYYYTPPAKPPTPRQAAQRQRFATAHAIWKALNPEQKYNLEEASRRLSLRITGKNLYMSASLRNMTEQYHTVERQSGLPLPPVEYVPYP